MNLFDITQDFSTEEKCIAHIENRRWPDGKVRCTTCGNDKISRITSKKRLLQEQALPDLPRMPREDL